MREVIKEARNVEEAINLACKELGAERDTVDFEIISLPKRTFFGLRNTPAKVRVYIDEPEKAPVKMRTPPPPPRRDPPKPAPKLAPKPIPESRPAPKPQPKPESRPAPADQPKPAISAATPKFEPKPESAMPVGMEPEQREPDLPMAELHFVPAETLEGKARTASDYVKDVLAEMGVQAEIAIAFTENGIVMRLSGGGLGVIIGRRGETLDALQYLAGLVSNRQEGDYMRVTIDSGNYREKRERTLQQLAQKLSASAIRYGRASTLEPMNPYERRIIHSSVSKIEGVSSTSIGEEPNRRVVISPTNLRPQGNRPNRSGPRPPRREGERPPFVKRPDSRPPEARAESKPTQPHTFIPNTNKPFTPNTNRPFEPRHDNRSGEQRPPLRRDNREGFAPREAVKPTSTAVDREYMKQLDLVNAEHPKSVATEKPIPQPTAPSREQERAQSKDLPLYGKIDL